jgi:hypothetical protein
MAKKPEPPKPVTWDVYRGAHKPKIVGNVQAVDADNAVQKAERAVQHVALRVVERWNAERSPLWSPTIQCAILAGTPWLDLYCPGCRTSRAIDIRTMDRTRSPRSAAS